MMQVVEQILGESLQKCRLFLVQKEMASNKEVQPG